jgi:hypothetical protein
MAASGTSFRLNPPEPAISEDLIAREKGWVEVAKLQAEVDAQREGLASEAQNR